MVHLDRLDLGGQVGGGESDDHAGFQDAGLNTADGDSSNTFKEKCFIFYMRLSFICLFCMASNAFNY